MLKRELLCTGVQQSPEWCLNGVFLSTRKISFFRKSVLLLFCKELIAGSSLFFCIPSATVAEQLD